MLAKSGSQPNETELDAIQEWLQQNQLEEAMYKGKRWAQGLTLAVLVFAGTALLDGQEVEAPEQETSAEPVWHTVRSVMDIDNLPEGVTHVRANGLSAAYLEFFSEVKSLRAIEFRGARDMHSRYLQALKGLPELRHLDLRDSFVPRVARWDSNWSKSVDLSVLLEFPKLEFLGTMIFLEFDLRQALPWEDATLGDPPPRPIDVLKQLGDRGVSISLGTSSYPERVLDVLAEFVPGLHSIGLKGAGDVQLRALRNFADLRGLELVGGDATELGYAYLARNLKLTELRVINGRLTPAVIHHVGRMEGLTSLELFSSAERLSPQDLEKLGALRKLRHLSLSDIPSNLLNRSEGRWKDDLAAALRALPPLSTFKLVGDYHYDEYYPHLFEVLSHTHAETVQLELVDGDFPYVFENSDYAKAATKSDGPRGPTALRLSIYVSDSEGWSGDPYSFGAALAQFANLKTFTLSITSTDDDTPARLAMKHFDVQEFRSAMPEGVKLEVVYEN